MRFISVYGKYKAIDFTAVIVRSQPVTERALEQTFRTAEGFTQNINIPKIVAHMVCFMLKRDYFSFCGNINDYSKLTIKFLHA